MQLNTSFKWLMTVASVSILLMVSVILFYSRENHAYEEAGGIKESIDFWHAQRAFPGNNINMAAYSSAWEQAQLDMSEYRQTGTGNWTAIGPKNFGGRTLFLAFNPQNPNTIYAGSASGGLWRSYSAGIGVNAWHYVPTGFPVLGVAAIAVDPIDTNVIYIGTGEVYNYQNTGTGYGIRVTRGTYGIGILKSVNNGVSWSKSLDWTFTDLRGIQDIIINPLRPATIWAATSEGTYISYNSGFTWSLKHTVIMATDIEMHPNDTSTLFLACGNFGTSGHGIYRTTNGGNTFSKLVSGLPASYSGKTLLDICASTPSTIYASIADSLVGIGLYASTDGGNSWTVRSVEDYPKYQGWFSHDVAVQPTNQNTVICAGVEVFKSTNGGPNLIKKSVWNSWDFSATPIGGPEGPPEYVHADIHHIIYQPGSNNTVYFATDGGIFRSTDNGENFEGCNGMYQTTQFYANFSSSTTDSLFGIGGMQDNATTIYQGNLAWRRAIGGDGLSTGINPQNDSVVYASTQYLNMYRSTNKAQNFSYLNGLPSGNLNNTNFAGPFELCPGTPATLYAGRLNVYKSTNTGNSWTTGPLLDGNPVLTLAVANGNCNLVYAGTAPTIVPASKIFKTSNGGTSWTDVTGTLPNRYPMDIAIHPVSNNIVYVAFSGYGPNHLFKSTDGGASWVPVPGLPNVPLNTILLDPLDPNYMYVGNDLGVYFSSDAGNTWQSFNDGLNDATMVMHISISTSNRKLRLATHGKGIWERKMVDPTLTGTMVDRDLNPVMKIYPNPARSFATVEFTSFTGSDTRISVLNSKGELMYESAFQSHGNGTSLHKLPVSSLTSGTYFVKMEDAKSRISRKLLIVK
jgi:hypothetical protein